MSSFKTSVISVLAIFLSIGLYAQNRTVTGVVRDVNSQPLPGAGVVLHGTTKGTVTDVDGQYSLSVPEGETVLVFSCLGYISQNITVAPDRTRLDVILTEDNMALDEIVVVGYGTQKKVNLTGAVTALESKALEKRSVADLSVMLQGTVPGLNITTSSGVPGSHGSLNIRGYTSINSAGPLVLIDGSAGDLYKVNPNDVESISVIKDASAAAVYGARAAFGVILVTTKSGNNKDGNATVRYSGRFGWQEPTTSTDYETRGYWSVYAMNKFREETLGTPYVLYNDYDMQQLLLRVNDVTEHPDRPWTVLENRNGRDQWFYYGNHDWWHNLFNDQHPEQQHNLSISGGKKGVKYFLSGGFNQSKGMLKINPDVFRKYNLRAKIDVDINKYIKLSNNTSFYSDSYDYIGGGTPENVIAYSAAHALPIFPMTNPDGSWVYLSHHLNGSYAIANGRHITLGNDNNINKESRTDFTNTTELRITPVRHLDIVGNFTYRFKQYRETNRTTNITYRDYPDDPLSVNDTGMNLNEMNEYFGTHHFYTANIFATYENTWADAHHFTGMIGGNYEANSYKRVTASGQNLIVDNLSDLDLVGMNKDGEVVTAVGGGQSEYALLGFFGRLNYDYKGRYLFEVSGRYDGTSRFGKGHRWGFFPSVSAGWRISEEPFFKNAKKYVDNLKLRFSFGTLGNQNVSNYYYLRTVSLKDFKSFGFGESTPAKYASLSAPNADDLTWERTEQYNLGIDFAAFKNRLQFTAEAYIRDTKDMLADGVQLPSVYGISVPKQNAANLRTKGYELSLSWKDQFFLCGQPFGYSVGANLSQYDSEITKYDNPERTFAKSYYVGQKLGEIWGFSTDGFFASDAEAEQYSKDVDLAYISRNINNGWKAGDLKYVDTDGDGKIGIGANTVDNPGDRKILGNKLPRLSYGFNFGLDWMGIDFSMFFQGTGNHYWYPNNRSFIFWGPYCQPMTSFMPRDFMDDVWDVDNTDAFFPRARSYMAYNGYLSHTNDRYIQNVRYLRLKNVSLGYSFPDRWMKKIHVEKLRIYFSGENLAYWSPFKKASKYIDPEATFNRSGGDAYNRLFYPWQKTYMFGIDLTF